MIPSGQVGAPALPRLMGHSGQPRRFNKLRATKRAAPLARRTATMLLSNAGASSSRRASSSPGKMRRCPTNTPETASSSIAVENDRNPVTLMRLK